MTPPVRQEALKREFPPERRLRHRVRGAGGRHHPLHCRNARRSRACWATRPPGLSTSTSQRDESGRGLLLLVDVVGFTSGGLSHTSWAGFRENVRLSGWTG